MKFLLAVISSALVANAQRSSSVTTGTGTTKTTAPTSVAATTTANASAAPTSTPKPPKPSNDTLPAQAPLPPKQAWCPSEIFCAGSLLQTVNIAQPYGDSKTIVDKPTTGTANATVAQFNKIAAAGVQKITYGQIVDFEEDYFKGEGLELVPTSLLNFPASPKFLTKIVDPIVKGFALEVHKIWNLLIRTTDPTELCTAGACESSLIPLNHTFVVPGGRFREQYYWDSYFIVEGLILSELYDVVKSTLENFMDEIERFGFIPNGGRIYYLNRSQPPLFIHMLYNYVNATQDTAILTRALPLAEAELKWWDDNRTVNITSPYTHKKHTLSHYAVVNSAPRPESYREDYEAANGADIKTPLKDAQKAALYAELASGAESGWDYSSRWIKQNRYTNLTNTTPALRTLNVRDTIPVDLNSILYKARMLLADLYDPSGPSSIANVTQASKDRAAYHRLRAVRIKTGVLDLFWDPSKLAFYDFNATSNARGTAFTAAHFYPFWVEIYPREVLKDENTAFAAFSSLHLVLSRFNGTLPATFIETGLQWDWPNSWPPHIYVALEALAKLPKSLTKGDLPSKGNSYTYIPKGQLGITEKQLPLQTLSGNNTVKSGIDINALNGTVVNGGVAVPKEGWARALGRELANRYATSVFCGWRATGGSIPNLLPKLSDAELNVTQSIGQDGHLFEKFSALDIDSAGRGGEYAVQAGFGWTNGVLLWVGANYGNLLAKPVCPPLL